MPFSVPPELSLQTQPTVPLSSHQLSLLLPTQLDLNKAATGMVVDVISNLTHNVAVTKLGSHAGTALQALGPTTTIGENLHAAIKAFDAAVEGGKPLTKQPFVKDSVLLQKQELPWEGNLCSGQAFLLI